MSDDMLFNVSYPGYTRVTRSKKTVTPPDPPPAAQSL